MSVFSKNPTVSFIFYFYDVIRGSNTPKHCSSRNLTLIYLDTKFHRILRKKFKAIKLKGSKQYFRYFLMLTLKDFYSTAFSIFGNSTPVSMDFSTKFNFCSVHMCLNPRKSLKTKKNALNFKKRLIFNKKPDFLVI